VRASRGICARSSLLERPDQRSPRYATALCPPSAQSTRTNCLSGFSESGGSGSTHSCATSTRSGSFRFPHGPVKHLQKLLALGVANRAPASAEGTDLNANANGVIGGADFTVPPTQWLLSTRSRWIRKDRQAQGDVHLSDPPTGTGGQGVGAVDTVREGEEEETTRISSFEHSHDPRPPGCARSKLSHWRDLCSDCLTQPVMDLLPMGELPCVGCFVQAFTADSIMLAWRTSITWLILIVSVASRSRLDARFSRICRSCSRRGPSERMISAATA
jgi:hypothetical protein